MASSVVTTVSWYECRCPAYGSLPLSPFPPGYEHPERTFSKAVPPLIGSGGIHYISTQAYLIFSVPFRLAQFAPSTIPASRRGPLCFSGLRCTLCRVPPVSPVVLSFSFFLSSIGRPVRPSRSSRRPVTAWRAGLRGFHVTSPPGNPPSLRAIL